MEWLIKNFTDICCEFQWYMVVPGLLAHVMLPLITFFFYCRYCTVPFRWRQGICYMALSVATHTWEIIYHLQGSFGLVAEILLLTCCGRALLKRKWVEAMTMSVLVLSVLSVSGGITSWAGYRILLPFLLEHEQWIPPSDTVRECLRLLLVNGLYIFILRHFREDISKTNRQTLIQLTIPVFFISLVMRIIQVAVYGDEIQVDTGSGQIRTMLNINHGELLFVQFFACICLLAILSAYQKILQILRAEQRLCLLEQQAEDQKHYMQEAVLRERQTRAFRHDIQNHLTVLTELLKTGKTSRAIDYLIGLEQTAAELSCVVRTGNAAVDALLGSKFSAAKQKGIRIECELAIPGCSAIQDIDWCVLLSNAVDNAIRACEEVPEEERLLRMFSRKKGNFWMLTIENSCEKELQILPREGVGLSNIRAVVQKNHGTVENAVSDGTYRLWLLFGSLQQETDGLHQSCDSQNGSDDIEKEELLINSPTLNRR